MIELSNSKQKKRIKDEQNIVCQLLPLKKKKKIIQLTTHNSSY